MDPAAIELTTSEAQVVSAVALIITSGLAALFASRAVREARLTREETRRAREQAIRPALALDLVSVTHKYVEVGIANVGQGASLDVQVSLTFHAGRSDAATVARFWRWPLIRPGERFQFAPPGIGEENRPDLETWSGLWSRVTLAGAVRDQLGERHEIDEAILDVQDLRTFAVEAGLAGLRETAEQRNAKAVAKAAGEVSSRIGRVAAALERIAPGRE